MPTGDFLVRSIEQRTSAGSNKPYLTLRLAKEGGEQIGAKVWAEKITTEEVKAGDVIATYYAEQTYQGSPQLILEKYSVRPDADVSKFKAPAQIDQEAVYYKLFHHQWANEDIEVFFKNLVEVMESPNRSPTLKERLLEVPAGAKNHHSRRGGLLQHCEEMWEIADAILETSQGKRMRVDREILRASVLIHDIGKIYEYSMETLGYEETRDLALMGHTAWGAAIVNNFWPPKGDKEVRNRIVHCVLSHHGKLEFGAPVVPKTPEAVILALMDGTSAKLDVLLRVQDVPGKPDYSMTLGCTPVTDAWP